jgi:hypothetical protein
MRSLCLYRKIQNEEHLHGLSGSLEDSENIRIQTVTNTLGLGIKHVYHSTHIIVKSVISIYSKC